MEKHALVEGRQYGYREKSTLGTPFLKVKLLEKVTGRPKVKIRFEDGPYPGLEEFVLTLSPPGFHGDRFGWFPLFSRSRSSETLAS